MSLYRAEKLIDLACSTTHEEEARTAALTACRLIRRHGLRLSEAAAAGPTAWAGQRAEPARPAPRPAARVREKPPNGGAWTRASRSGRCASCGDGYAAGDEVYGVQSDTWCASH
jgi:hypothetical protein